MKSLKHSDRFPSALKQLAKLLENRGFLAADGPTEPGRILDALKKSRLSSKDFVSDSVRCKSGRTYLVARMGLKELLVCLEPSTCRDPIPVLFENARRYVLRDGQESTAVYVLPFTSDNLRRLLDEVLPEAGPRNLGSTPRLGLGVRMLFTLPVLLKALRQIRAISDFQLSAGREFSLSEVVTSPPGRYPEWLGHTGLDAATIYGTIAKECFKSGLPVYGTEIDHLIVTGRPEEAISRIRDHSSHPLAISSPTSETCLQESIKYNRKVIDEATGTGFVRGMTVDTSSLLAQELDDATKWTGSPLRDEFERQFPEEERNALLGRYRPGEPFKFQARDCDEAVQLAFSDEDVMRLALKFKPSLAINKELFDYMSKAMKGKTFVFEPSLDEAPKLTTSKELLFYLAESKEMGMPASLVAPNVGFRKREDYDGDLNELRNRVRELSIIASSFGAILDFHSGSDKSPQVYRTVSAACHGKLKLKMSGVYQLLYFDTLASFPRRSKERQLFERIWHYTLSYAVQKAGEGDTTARRQVEQIQRKIREAGERRRGYHPNPKDDFFRYYSFIAVAAKRKNGTYLFRGSLYKLAQKRHVLKRYSQKVIHQTKAVAEALGLSGGRTLLEAVTSQ